MCTFLVLQSFHLAFHDTGAGRLQNQKRSSSYTSMLGHTRTSLFLNLSQINSWTIPPSSPAIPVGENIISLSFMLPFPCFPHSDIRKLFLVSCVTALRCMTLWFCLMCPSRLMPKAFLYLFWLIVHASLPPPLFSLGKSGTDSWLLATLVDSLVSLGAPCKEQICLFYLSPFFTTVPRAR